MKIVTIPSCVALGEFRGALPSDLPPRKAANKIKSVFSGGVYLGKNTSCDDEQGHALKNIGKEDLETIALILYRE